MKDENKTMGQLIAELNELRSEFEKTPKERQPNRLEMLGALAGGMAHDLNNILGAIIGYAEIMELFEDSSKEESKTRIRGILRAAYRAKGLVEQIHLLSSQTDGDVLENRGDVSDQKPLTPFNNK
jgi:signal transduction histidine kinase